MGAETKIEWCDATFNLWCKYDQMDDFPEDLRVREFPPFGYVPATGIP